MSREILPMRTTEDLVRYLTSYPEQIVLGERPAEEIFDTHHTEDYVLVNDGIALDRGRLLDHVGPVRKRTSGVTVDVRDALVQDDRVAARYEMTAHMRNGGRIVSEIYFFGRLASDGRLCRADQVTRTP